MKNQGGRKTLDLTNRQSQLKKTNAGKTDDTKEKEMLKIMSALKDQSPKP